MKATRWGTTVYRRYSSISPRTYCARRWAAAITQRSIRLAEAAAAAALGSKGVPDSSR